MGAKQPAEHYRITPKLLKDIENYGSLNLTMGQIASCIGWSRTKLYDAAAQHPDISDAIKRGKDRRVASLVQALVEKAESLTDTTALIFLLKTVAPQQFNEKFMDTNEEIKLEGTAPEQLLKLALILAEGKIDENRAATISNLIVKAVEVEEVTELKEQLAEVKQKLGIE